MTPDLLCAQHGTGCWRHRHDLSMGGSSYSCTRLFTQRSLPTYQVPGTALGANDTSVNEQIRPNLPSWSSGKTISTVDQSCPTLCDPMDCSTAGFPVHHQLLGFAQFLSLESMMPSNHCILCHPLLLPPSIFPSIRVFSSVSVHCIRWRKYWSFSFSSSPSNEYYIQD